MKYKSICIVAFAASQPIDALLGGLFNPTIKLDYGTFRGLSDLRTSTNSFLGMPFATGGRMENPRVIGKANKLNEAQDATKYGPACPQVELTASPLYPGNSKLGRLLTTAEYLVGRNVTQQDENCLSINVQVPKGAKPGDKLPVMMWIYGGGFELGSSAALGLEFTGLPGVIYQGANLVKRSIEMDQKVVFVSANYRVNAFGGLASKETQEAGVGNLLLKDQRVAMEWIQKYIGKFGGDPDQVTIFGESAGSMSIAVQMLLNDGNPDGLFHSAIMLSGGPGRFDDYRRGQSTFDGLSKSIGCADADHKIKCWRRAKYEDIYTAVQEIPNFFSYLSTAVPWYPRPDGTFLTDSPHRLLRTGKIAQIPYMISDMRDEGTLFSLVNQFNITTDDDLEKYIKTIFFPNATPAEIRKLMSHYPNDPAKGSPFGTGNLNQIGPMYKRIAALTGDVTFEASRRDLLNYAGDTHKAWTFQIRDSIPILGQSSFLSGLDLSGLPILGSFHVSDVALYVFGNIPATISHNTRNLMSTMISFANHHDPNHHGLKDLPHWPQWTSKTNDMYVFAEDGCRIIKDDYRKEAIEYINAHGDAFRF